MERKENENESLSADSEQENLTIPFHSEEVQEIIGKMPHWILRYGVILLLIIFAGLIFGAYIIKFPDTLDAKALITAQYPPIAVIPKINGKLQKLLVQNNQLIGKNQPIAILENYVNYDSITYFKKIIIGLSIEDTIKTESLNNLFSHQDILSDLNEICPSSIAFEESIRNYLYAKSDRSFILKIQNARKQIDYQKRLQKNIKQQTKLANEKLSIEQEKYNSHLILSDNKMIAPIEFNEVQKGLLDQKMSYQSFVSTLLDNQLNIEQINQLIINLEQQEKDRLSNSLIRLKQAQQTLIAEIDNWEQKFVLKSPQVGKIVFLKAWSENQDLLVSEPAFMVISPSQKIIGRVLVPLYKSAKMKTNQIVNIKLDNYPFEQYGILKGRIENISEVPLQDNYIVTVSLPQDLKTTYNKKLHYFPEMKGDAQIILKDERLLLKLFYKFRKYGEDF